MQMAINYAYIIIAFAISLVFSLVCTPFVVKMCNTHELFDLPNTRKVHKNAIPRLGGSLFMPSLSVGVVITLLIMYQVRLATSCTMLNEEPSADG